MAAGFPAFFHLRNRILVAVGDDLGVISGSVCSLLACRSGGRGPWVIQCEYGARGGEDPCLSSPRCLNTTWKALNEGLFPVRSVGLWPGRQEQALEADGPMHIQDSSILTAR